jgi:hypothetical protein
VSDVASIQARAVELGPWVNSFEYGGKLFPSPDGSGSSLAPRAGRAQAFFDVFPDARRILELGSLEGADTVRLAQRPGTNVVAVEGRADNVARAEFVVGLHGLRNVTLVHADVESVDLAALGAFDAVLCAGLLYHLQEPWRLLATLGAMTTGLFVSTHYWGGETDRREGGYAVKIVHEDHPEPRTRALTPTVLWFDRASIFQALTDAGLDDVQIVAERRTREVCDIILAARPTSPRPIATPRQ